MLMLSTLALAHKNPMLMLSTLALAPAPAPAAPWRPRHAAPRLLSLAPAPAPAAPWSPRHAAPRLLCDFNSLDWDSYHDTHTNHEWILPADDHDFLRRLRHRLRGLPPSAPILELGSGTSSLAAHLYDTDGWRDVTAVDISSAAIATARARHGLGNVRPGLKFRVADARNLLGIKDGSIGAVIDKGTLDAVCCGEGWDYEAKRVASEVNRVLAPGGRWVCLSLMPPSVLMPLLQGGDGPPKWSVFDCEAMERGRAHLYAATRSRRFRTSAARGRQ